MIAKRSAGLDMGTVGVRIGHDDDNLVIVGILRIKSGPNTWLQSYKSWC